MPLFRQPKYDKGAEADRARALLEGATGRHNVTWTPYVIPFLAALLAIAVAAHALSRPSVKDRLHRKPPVGNEFRLFEVDLE